MMYYIALLLLVQGSFAQPAKACQGTASSWNAGYGNCGTYAAGSYNSAYCSDIDAKQGFSANDACPQCGKCNPPDIPNCADGYYQRSADCPGWGKISRRGGGEVVSSCDKCAQLCTSFEDCLSYECSPSQLKCNLNTQQGCTAPPFQDYALCKKNPPTTTTKATTTTKDPYAISGKQACEGHGFDKNACDYLGYCCKFDGGKCVSAIGEDECDTSGYEVMFACVGGDGSCFSTCSGEPDSCTGYKNIFAPGQCASTCAQCVQNTLLQLKGCALNVDCEGTWSECSSACESAADRVFSETQAQSGTGAPCPTATDCQPGEGGCPLKFEKAVGENSKLERKKLLNRKEAALRMESKRLRQANEALRQALAELS